MGWQPNEPVADDIILYADNVPVITFRSSVENKSDIPKPKYSNCPNCGAPVNGPICEYCGSILSNEETEQTEYELIRIRKQLAKAKWAWEESVIQAELMQNLFQQSQQQIKYDLQSQICCDIRTQVNINILQSPDYIPKPVPLAIEEKQTKDFGYEDTFWIWVIIAIIVIFLIAAPIAVFLA